MSVKLRFYTEYCLKEPQAAEWSSGRIPACCTEGRVQTLDGEPKNFQYRSLSAETQQPVDRMRHKARGCLLVLNVLC